MQSPKNKKSGFVAFADAKTEKQDSKNVGKNLPSISGFSKLSDQQKVSESDMFKKQENDKNKKAPLIPSLQDDEEDEELQAAIKMSLNEQNSKSMKSIDKKASSNLSLG